MAVPILDLRLKKVNKIYHEGASYSGYISVIQYAYIQDYVWILNLIICFGNYRIIGYFSLVQFFKFRVILQIQIQIQIKFFESLQIITFISEENINKLC
jgi:hypothetical protein